MPSNLTQLKNKALNLHKSLSEKEITVNENGIRVVITATQVIKDFSIEGISSKEAIEALNKAIRLSEKAEAEELVKTNLS